MAKQAAIFFYFALFEPGQFDAWPRWYFTLFLSLMAVLILANVVAFSSLLYLSYNYHV